MLQRSLHAGCRLWLRAGYGLTDTGRDYMKATLELADTPQGITATLRWDGNDYTDHLADSLSMMLMAQFTELIKTHAKVGAIRLLEET